MAYANTCRRRRVPRSSAVALAFRTHILTAAGRLLVVDNPVASADLIVVSIGAREGGVPEAADLLHRGVAPQVAVLAEPLDEVDREFIGRGLPYFDPAAQSIRELDTVGVTHVVRIPQVVAGTRKEGNAQTHNMGDTLNTQISNNMLWFAIPVLALILSLAMASGTSSGAEVLAPIQLPPPQTDGGRPLMKVLKLRATSRSFAPDPIPAQTLSNLLWAAWGINRPADGKRTAPSARNWQEIDLMVVRADGTFLYDAAANQLRPVAAGDHRALTGVESFVKSAPLTLLLVADTSRMEGLEKYPETRQWLWADAGFISQNIYLFCASEGLATGVRAWIDRPVLAKALRLREHQVILLAQCVGRPAR